MFLSEVNLESNSSLEFRRALRLRAFMAVAQMTLTVTCDMVSPCVLLAAEKAFKSTLYRYHHFVYFSINFRVSSISFRLNFTFSVGPGVMRVKTILVMIFLQAKFTFK